MSGAQSLKSTEEDDTWITLKDYIPLIIIEPAGQERSGQGLVYTRKGLCGMR